MCIKCLLILVINLVPTVHVPINFNVISWYTSYCDLLLFQFSKSCLQLYVVSIDPCKLDRTGLTNMYLCLIGMDRVLYISSCPLHRWGVIDLYLKLMFYWPHVYSEFLYSCYRIVLDLNRWYWLIVVVMCKSAWKYDLWAFELGWFNLKRVILTEGSFFM